MTSVLRYSQGPGGKAKTERLWEVVEKYHPKSESFALEYGKWTLFIPAAVTGYLSQRFFNKCYKLGRRGTWYTYPAVVVLPGFAASLMHHQIVTEDILSERDTCSGCKEFYSASMHIMISTLWSFLLAGFTSHMVGSLKKTIYVPQIDKYPLQTLSMIGAQYKKFARLGITLCLANFTYVLLLFSLESYQYDNIKARLLVRVELTRPNVIVTQSRKSDADEFYS